MNGKRAKELRRVARERSAMPGTWYGQRHNTPVVGGPTHKLRVLNPRCERLAYQNLKERGNPGWQQGEKR